MGKPLNFSAGAPIWLGMETTTIARTASIVPALMAEWRAADELATTQLSDAAAFAADRAGRYNQRRRQEDATA